MAIKEKESQITLSLTADEAYTLQIVLGYVAGDSEIYSVMSKLEGTTGEDMDMDDYGRVSFIVTGEDSAFQVCKEHEVQIQIN